MRKKLKLLLIFLFSLVLLTSGCMSIDKYRKERIIKADKSFKQIKGKKFPKDVVLTLPFCIKTALKNNLDLKVYQLKEAVNNEKKTAALLGMLPNIVATNDLTERSNDPGASSYNITTGQESLPYSQSAEKQESRVRVELLFSIIDFGLSYFRAVQQHDKSIITTEQKRRAAQNLILNVTRAYFRVASAQYAMKTTEKMLKLSEDSEALLKEMAKNQTVPLANVLEENKKYVVLKKALMEYRRSYQNSCIELRTLMGFYPTHEIQVDTSSMNEINEVAMLNMDFLEETALIKRPELFQLDVQSHITTVEARKTLLMMFPNVSIFGNFTNSTNKFLYNQTWWESGVRAAYQLLRLPQHIENYLAFDTELEQLDAQVLALSIGVLAQVRIAYANLIEVKERYDLADHLYKIYKKHEAVVEAKAKSAGIFSKIELNRVKMETAQKTIERTQTLGNYYLAYYRLLNAIGVESLDVESINKLKKRVKIIIDESIEDEIDKLADLNDKRVSLENEISEIKNKLLNLNKKSLTKKQKDKNFNDEINEYKNELRTKQKDRLKINKEIFTLKTSIATNYKRLNKYNQAIELLLKNQIKNLKEKALSKNSLNKKFQKEIPKLLESDINSDDLINEIEKSAKTVEDENLVSSMNMEMQQQTSNNTISPEEFSNVPEKNIVMETQLDSGNNSISAEAFSPENQKNITIETQKDAGNNQIVSQEFSTSSKNAVNNENQKVDRVLSEPLIKTTPAPKAVPGATTATVASTTTVATVASSEIANDDNAKNYAIFLNKAASEKEVIKYKDLSPKRMQPKIVFLKTDGNYMVVYDISKNYETVKKECERLKNVGYDWIKLIEINSEDIINLKSDQITENKIVQKVDHKPEAENKIEPEKISHDKGVEKSEIKTNKPQKEHYAIVLNKSLTKEDALKYMDSTSWKIKKQLLLIKKDGEFLVIYFLTTDNNAALSELKILQNFNYSWAYIMKVNPDDIIESKSENIFENRAKRLTTPPKYQTSKDIDKAYAILLNKASSTSDAIKYINSSSPMIKDNLLILKTANDFWIIYEVSKDYDAVKKVLERLRSGSYDWVSIVEINRNDIIPIED